MHIEINNLVKQLRIEYGYSQKDLATLIHCSPQHISRLEKGHREVTDELISSLSKVFNVDFFHLKSKLERFNSIADYTDFYFLRQCIEKEDFVGIEEKIHELDACPNRFNYGDPLLLKQYCKALILSIQHKEYIQSTELCYFALNCSEEDLLSFVGNSPKISTYYSIAFLLLFNYYHVGKIDTALKISEQLLKHFRQMQNNSYFSFVNQEYFFNKAYISILNNSGYLQLENKEYSIALDIANLALDTCNKLNQLKYLSSLYDLKFECLYNLERFSEAKDVYKDFISICRITDNLTYFENRNARYKDLGYLDNLDI